MRLTELEAKLGHVFRDKGLLERAVTHASASARTSNERLEFLGDRVLGLVVAEMLFHANPDDAEGLMALKYNALVRGETCAAVAEAAGLAEFVVLAASEAAGGGRRNAAILAGLCEAILAALYLDGGFETARGFIERHWAGPFAELGADMRDAKTALQEWAQSRLRVSPCPPSYCLVKREGPDHAPRFFVEVRIGDEEAEMGEGRSKREAEQAAAKAMLARLGESLA